MVGFRRKMAEGMLMVLLVALMVGIGEINGFLFKKHNVNVSRSH